MIDFDLDAFLEQSVRRERALQGSRHGADATRTHIGPREDAESPLDRPTLLWPDQRHRVPTTCWHCGAGRANFETDPPYGAVKRGEVTCGTCSRLIVNLKDAKTQSGRGRSVPTIVEHPCVDCGKRERVLGLRRCGSCAALARNQTGLTDGGGAS